MPAAAQAGILNYRPLKAACGRGRDDEAVRPNGRGAATRRWVVCRGPVVSPFGRESSRLAYPSVRIRTSGSNPNFNPYAGMVSLKSTDHYRPPNRPASGNSAPAME